MSIAYGARQCRCTDTSHRTRLVAITGGPGAGKTAILELAARALCSHVAILPEAAGIVFGGGFPRRDSDIGRRTSQRAIYAIQRELEQLILNDGTAAVALCDRGTIDGAAYWPGTPDSYWSALGIDRHSELIRYHAVVHLRTPPEDRGYDHSNALRVESASEAGALDALILSAWDGHPNRVVIESADDFMEKAARALAAVQAQLPPCCAAHPLPSGTPDP